MNKVITINLNGVAYQLEEGGYEALRAYLEAAGAKLGGNPDKDEIIADIEQAFGEKFRTLLGAQRNVVSTKEVEAVIKEMGPVDDGSGGATAGAGTPGKPGSAAAGASTNEPKRPRRLYRLNEGAMLAGVCSGLAVFTGVPALAFRIGFVVLTIVTWGVGLLAYLAFAFFVPMADSPTERAEAQGPTPTTQDFINRARQGYYEAMKNMPDKTARREWKRKFRRDMREWKHNFRWEMRENASRWGRNFDHYWAQNYPRMPGWPLIAFVCGLASLAVFVFFLLGAISLIKTGSIFGFFIPAGMPVWVAILLLVVLFQFVVWPLRIMKYMAYGGHGCHGGGGGFVLLLVLFGLCWWLYPQQTKDVIHEIPPTVHRAVDSLHDWWNEHDTRKADQAADPAVEKPTNTPKEEAK